MWINLFIAICVAAVTHADTNPTAHREIVQKNLKVLVKSEWPQKLLGGKSTDSVYDHFSLKPDRLDIFATLKDKQENKPEYTLVFVDPPAPAKSRFTLKTGDKPLKGLRVALDPGHIGGAYSKIENRQIEFADQEGVVKEGDLTFLTAKGIKKLLEDKGAEVFLTRTKIGKAVFPIPFQTWVQDPEKIKKGILDLEKNPEAWQETIKNLASKDKEISQKAQSQIYRGIYNNLDMKARVEAINKFEPHLTFSIHYDANHLTPIDSPNPSQKNYNSGYIPGQFMFGELAKVSERQDFLRLATSNAYEDSKNLCTHLVKALNENTGIGPLTIWEHSKKALRRQTYSHEPWWGQFFKGWSTGIYTRNLYVPRKVHGIVCLGESLIANNLKEFKRLSTKDTIVTGVHTSHRVEQVARSYVEAVLNFYQ